MFTIRKSWLFGCFYILFIMACISEKLYSQEYGKNNTGISQLAIKTNLLYDGAMTPNIGIVAAFGDEWSLNADWIFAWWSNDNKHRYWRINAGELEVRRWLGNRTYDNVLLGQHVGYYFMGGMYDFERGHKGYQSSFTANTGFSYGYSVKIARSCYLDFTVGIGFLMGRRKKYKPVGNEYCRLTENALYWFGPTKAEISFVWCVGDLILKRRKVGSNAK